MVNSRKLKSYWTKERCVAEAQRYKSRSEFKAGSRSAYTIACKNGWLNDLGVPSLRKPCDFDSCLREALKYKSKAQFKANSPREYSAMCRYGWRDVICAHFISHQKPKKYWTKELCIEEARKYKSRDELKEKCGGAYAAAYRNGWLDDIGLSQLRKTWDIETCRLEAIKYTVLKDFISGCPAAYAACYRHGWVKEICSHMVSPHKPMGHWTKARCREEATKFRTRAEFQNGSPSAYRIAQQNRWLDEICHDHEFDKLPNGHWTSELCKAEALKYETRSAFKTGSQPAFYAAIRHGILEKICGHMRIVGNARYFCVYWIKSHETREIYIGITHDFDERTHGPDQADAHRLRKSGEYTKLSNYIPQQEARAIEVALIEHYRNSKEWKCVNRHRGGGVGTAGKGNADPRGCYEFHPEINDIAMDILYKFLEV